VLLELCDACTSSGTMSTATATASVLSSSDDDDPANSATVFVQVRCARSVRCARAGDIVSVTQALEPGHPAAVRCMALHGRFVWAGLADGR
jgi:hypothetical protein